MGGKIDRDVNKNGGPLVFRIHGQNFHYIGSLLPVDGKRPHFAQLYIYDTNNEIVNRLSFVRPDGDLSDIHEEIVKDIQQALDSDNVLVKSFRMASSEIEKNPVAGWVGYPDLFITFTCNPKWPEVKRFLTDRNLKPEDRPDIICRLFKMKLDALISECRKNKLFGPVIGVIYTIEFQKCGLPHAHILLFLDKQQRASHGIHLDNIISAKLPDPIQDPEYFKLVDEYMMHGPCGRAQLNSPCMAKGKCTKHFPKKFVNVSNFDDDGYPIYRRRDNGRSVVRNGINLDNRYVVPHNRHLLLKYRGHINVEWCNQSRSINYLFKYVNKGHDRVTAEFYRSNSEGDEPQVIEEISMYYDCRYISPCEAAWRLFSFEIRLRTLAVERLSFHLPNQQSVVFADDDPVDNILSRPTILQSMFLEWFEANKTYPEARKLTYAKMPTKFVWKKDIRKWHPRKRGFSIGRVFYVPPGSGEIFYLRCLLNKVQGPTSFADIRTVNGVQYESFRDACSARGLVDDDKEYVHVIEEAGQWATSANLRRLFVTLLMSNSMSKPEVVWEATSNYLTKDAEFHIRQQKGLGDLILSEDQKKNYALSEIELLLTTMRKSLKDFPSIPSPDLQLLDRSTNRLIQEELSYDINAMKAENDSLVDQLTEEQKQYMITQSSPLAHLIMQSRLIIWDEAPMMHKFCFEALDRTMQDLLRVQNPRSFEMTFGGKTVVLGGDFKQILPVIPKGTRQDIVGASINSSYLWRSCKVFRLTKNLRLKALQSESRVQEIEEYAKWIANIGDGTIGDSLDGECEINIPEKFLLRSVEDPISTIVDSIFPGFRNGIRDVKYLKDCAILAPTLDVVDNINEYMNEFNTTEGMTYLSCDSVCKSDSNVDMLADLHTPEFLNGLRCSGVPNHSLTLKVGSPVMLLRNIDHSLRLCNGTRMIISKLATHVLEAQILTGTTAGTKVLIPRMSLTPSDPRLPFKFQRKQFPLMLSYAMTINKSQGQTLSNVGLFLKRPVFNHGQLYVAVSRVSNPSGLKMLICDENVQSKNTTTNVVYKELFNNV
ncbi:PREDICTED: uncharacterized protein LOC109180727 [Ipomoea nil]|uniref:uncharacterized protein LOC109180727 n=1 Tax=Ipomoea nil TaxID=35883 RepID=UPI000900DAE4|nr:PREDICTED: uncharacterized protein LOC109180727 [Ipomoea nil]